MERFALAFRRPPKPVLGYPEALGIVGGLSLLVARFVPLALLPFWGCAFRRLTGLPCPSCGGTRAFDWMMQGRFLEALRVNPLAFVLGLSVGVGLMYLAAMRLRPPRLAVTWTPRTRKAAWALALGAVAANWAYLLAQAL